MEPTRMQETIIRESRRVADDPRVIVPDEYREDLDRQNAYLVGYLTHQLRSLLAVAEDIAGITAEGGDH